MLLVVSGASGVGKSTVRTKAATALPDTFEAVELYHLDEPPAVPTLAWRQEVVELAAQRALELDKEGRHLLLCGDPVPAGEALAVPTAENLDIAVCLLHADKPSQLERIREREEPPEVQQLHSAFADWLLRHATDPTYLTEVVQTNGWDQMRWERWVGRPNDGAWAMTVIDTSPLSPEDVARQVIQWCHEAVAGKAPVFRAGWYR